MSFENKVGSAGAGPVPIVAGRGGFGGDQRAITGRPWGFAGAVGLSLVAGEAY